MFVGSRTHAVSFLRSVAIDIMFDLINNRLITEEQQWDMQAN
ncbi:hypothetical protein HpMS113_11040 [Helicobacter pylori]